MCRHMLLESRSRTKRLIAFKTNKEFAFLDVNITMFSQFLHVIKSLLANFARVVVPVCVVYLLHVVPQLKVSFEVLRTNGAQITRGGV